MAHPGTRWFTKTSIILFLNKIDLFRAKLPISPLSDTFPDYRGGANYDQACSFLLEKFVGLNKNPSKSIYAVRLSLSTGDDQDLADRAALHRCDRYTSAGVRHLSHQRRDHPR